MCENWFEILQLTFAGSTPNLTQKQLKQVVRPVAEEDDRSRNFMIFVLEENDSGDVECTVGAVLSELDEKPLTNQGVLVGTLRMASE